MGLLSLFNSNKKEIKKLTKRVEKINNKELLMQKLSDEELKNKTSEFKKRIKNGVNLDDFLDEAFAVVREASRRVLGMRHFDVQLMGGMVLHDGRIAEMKTGEGKTLVATLATYLNALTEKGVHVITVNDYLAKRDREEMGKVHEFLGLTVGLNVNGMTQEEKKEAYLCDITYGTNNEFGFDYLRDNMAVYKEKIVQRPLHYAIIDEVDSILIDEARTPLIISGSVNKPLGLYRQADQFVKTLKNEEHYNVDIKSKNVMLSELGVEKAEKYFSIENLFDANHIEINHFINQSLKANVIMKHDVDYVVKDGEVMIVDEFTGRIMSGRRYSNGLHQAIEAKEMLEIKNESTTLATITMQNYFRMYEKLSGMTGTAKTEEEEFLEIYNMDVVVIPTNKPMIREDKPDVVYKTEEGKYKAILAEIIESNKKGQPVLVGTTSIEKSEYISAYLKKKGIKHEVLNAKNHEKEAEIIEKAGEKGSVTIATNMAGRGTDIKLSEEVKKAGGLHIIGTERHESRRIDNQLRGRSGRQGDPGKSQFYLSLEDDLVKRFGSDRIKVLMERLGFDEETPIESKIVSKAVENAQKQVEGNNFDSRKHVLKYDNVLNEQRNIVYSQRKEVIESQEVEETILEMIRNLIKKKVAEYWQSGAEEEREIKGLVEYTNQKILYEQLHTEEIENRDYEELETYIQEKAVEQYEKKKEELGESFIEFQRYILLKLVDSKWMEHIESMQQLREGIHLRAYGQIDPLREYQQEGFYMFEQMIASIEEDVVINVMKSQVKQEVGREEVANQTGTFSAKSETIKRKPIIKKQSVGRNDPCPCGSGKKYKKCHG